MIFYKDKILVLPPKTGSRSAVAAVSGIDKYHRHEPVYNLSGKEREDKEIIMMVRDPYSWYESFWFHRIHTLPLKESEWWQHEFGKTEFHDALFDYCYGAEKEEVVALGGVPNGAQFSGTLGKEDINHMHYQNVWGVGYYSETMMWSACTQLKDKYLWNDDIKFVEMGNFQALSKLGFEVTPTPKVGRASYGDKKPEWSSVMRHWVNNRDGECWDYIQSRMVP